MSTGIRKLLKAAALLLYRLEARLLPLKQNMLLFESNVGRNYTGNPRFIYEELVRRGLDRKYQCFYIFENTAVELPGHAKKLRRLGLRYFYVLARAGVWVTDTRLPVWVKKRKGNLYIQTWHGTPLKKLALDMEEVYMEGEDGIEAYKENFKKCSSTWDYLISQNRFSTEIFRRAFAYEKEILEIGYPRNDILIRRGDDEAYKRKLQREMGLPEDKKVILYAPTWRDNEYSGHGAYRFHPRMDFAAMQEALSGEYIMLVKYHYLVQDLVDWSPYCGFIYPFDQKYDIAFLYLAADLLITDYSSVMFDYSLLGRPIFFYTYDLDNYRNHLRGFYFDLTEEAPGPVTLSTKELIQSILESGNGAYAKRYADQYEAFVKKYNHADNGSASAAVADLIIKKTGAGQA